MNYDPLISFQQFLQSHPLYDAIMHVFEPGCAPLFSISCSANYEQVLAWVADGKPWWARLEVVDGRLRLRDGIGFYFRGDHALVRDVFLLAWRDCRARPLEPPTPRPLSFYTSKRDFM